METEGAESWFAGLRRAVQSTTKSSPATADSLQPAVTQRKRSQMLTAERVRTHIQPTPQASVLVRASRALGALARLVWGAALLFPLERPKSASTGGQMKFVDSKDEPGDPGK